LVGAPAFELSPTPALPDGVPADGVPADEVPELELPPAPALWDGAPAFEPSLLTA